MTVHELILNQLLKSYVQIAKYKDEELGDSADWFELYRMNDHAFQDIIGSDFQNVFKKVIEFYTTKVSFSKYAWTIYIH